MHLVHIIKNCTCNQNVAHRNSSLCSHSLFVIKNYLVKTIFACLVRKKAYVRNQIYAYFYENYRIKNCSKWQKKNCLHFDKNIDVIRGICCLLCSIRWTPHGLQTKTVSKLGGFPWWSFIYLSSNILFFNYTVSQMGKKKIELIVTTSWHSINRILSIFSELHAFMFVITIDFQSI